MTSSNIRALVRELANLKSQVNALPSSSLKFSTVEQGGAITVREPVLDQNGEPTYNDDGIFQFRETISMGQQFDGSYAAAPVVSGQLPPPTPTAPTLVPVPGGLVIKWDGLFIDSLYAPMNYSRIETHLGYAAGFDASYADTIVGTTSSPRASYVVVQGLDPDQTYYAKLVARDQAGARGPDSNEDFANPLPVGTDQETRDAIAKAIADAGAAQEAAAAAQQTADSAQQTADTAQQTATTASETATGAAQTADQAQQAASDAQSSASAAQADADAAQQAADSASSLASGADTKATEAQRMAAYSVSSGTALPSSGYTATDEGATFYLMDSANPTQVKGVYQWTGSSWAERPFQSSVIADTLTGKTINGSIINGATINGGTVNVSGNADRTGSGLTVGRSPQWWMSVHDRNTANRYDMGAHYLFMSPGPLSGQDVYADGAGLQSYTVGTSIDIAQFVVQLSPGTLAYRNTQGAWAPGDPSGPPANYLDIATPGRAVGANWGGISGNVYNSESLWEFAYWRKTDPVLDPFIVNQIKGDDSHIELSWQRSPTNYTDAKSGVYVCQDYASFVHWRYVTNEFDGYFGLYIDDYGSSFKGPVYVDAPPAASTSIPVTAQAGSYTTTTAAANYVWNSACCGAKTFSAPPSGRVMVTHQGLLKATVAGQAAGFGIQVSAGTTVTGALYAAAQPQSDVRNYNTQFASGSASRLVEGLTPGGTYTAWQSVLSPAGGGTYYWGSVIVVPLP